MRTHALTASLLVVGVSLSPAAPSPDGLTLTAALARADLRSRAVATASARTFELEALHREARAQRWPSLRLRQRLTRVDSNTVERANAAAEGLSQLIGMEIPPFLFEDSYRTEAEAQMPIWTGGQLASSVAASSSLLTAAWADEEARRRTVRAAVVRAFFAQAASEATVGAREVALQRADRRLSENERRLEIGLSTRQEVLRWRVEVERARADVAAAEASVLLARVELADLLDLPFNTLEAASLPAPRKVDDLLGWARKTDLHELLMKAQIEVDQLPEVRAAQARSEAARAEQRAAVGALRPQVNGAVTYGWLENDTLALDEFDNWSATVLVEVPLDLRGSLSARVAAARARHTMAEIGVEDARAAIFKEIAAAAADLLRSRTRLASARRAVAEASARRELVDRQYIVGVVGLLDLIDADAVLASTEVEVVAARTEFLAAVARLELAYPALDIPVGGLIP